MGNEEYVFPSTNAEAQRLELQGSKLYGGVSFLEPFLARNPREILDVGCGSGFFTRHVADVMPAAGVTGLDIDAPRIAYARSHSTKKNIRFKLGDMASMPFADNSFDLVFCRFVLVHRKEATASLREMARVTRPGGYVAAYDMIHDGIWFVPDRPAFAAVLCKVLQVLRERGAEPNQGLFLASGMRRAGLADISARVIAHHALATEEIYAVCRDNWIATLKNLGERFGPLLDAEELKSALGELKRVSGDEFLVETTVLAWGKKT